MRSAIEALHPFDEHRGAQAGEVVGSEGKEPLLRHLLRQVVGEAGARVVAMRIGADDLDLGAGIRLADRLGRRQGARSAADQDVTSGHVSALSWRGGRTSRP